MLCFLYKLFIGQPFTSTTYRATISTKMYTWFLPKLTMFWTDYTHMLLDVLKFDFGVVILAMVYLCTSFDEYIMSDSLYLATCWALVTF